MAEAAVTAVLLDIEGTTTPIAFVHDVLFPFARAQLPALLATGAAAPEVAVELDAVRQLAPGRDPLAVLRGWMDADAKHTPLKSLQGLLWRQGYADGRLKGELCPDVAPALRRWHAAGRTLFVYSSGSVEAQQLIFRHSTSGDLAGLFAGFFDTRVGAKRDPDSYRQIARSAGIVPAAMLFLSDVEAELDAASSAGLTTCQLVRAADRTIPSARHPTEKEFDAVENRFSLG